MNLVKGIVILVINILISFWLVVLGPTISVGKFTSELTSIMLDIELNNEVKNNFFRKTLILGSKPFISSERKMIENDINNMIYYYTGSDQISSKEFKDIWNDKSIDSYLNKNDELLAILRKGGQIQRKPGIIAGLKNAFYVVFLPLATLVSKIISNNDNISFWTSLLLSWKLTFSLFFMSGSIFYYIFYFFSYIFALGLFWAPIGILKENY